MPRLLLLALLAILALTPASAVAAPVPEGAVYSEEYIPSSNPIPNDQDPKLHADVLRPKNATGKVPVLLTVSPYTNHSTQNGADADPTKSGPSDRFFDFVVRDAKLFDKGYAYVMVDLRGTGGSEGCNDWGGPGEQNDVKRAVEWAASQPWSNGKVALYGKSYDGWTGLMGITQKPQGLAAVISQEPVVDGYRYLYMNGVRFPNASSTPALFQVIDAAPGTINDDPEYQGSNAWANVVKPGCYAQNYADQQNNDPQSDYWKPRNLVPQAKGATTPTFFMQGFLESNTKPDAVFDFFNNLGGTENRAWFGQWNHVRGNDKDEDGSFSAGRSTFVEEAVRFLDEHLKGIQPAQEDPKIVVQSSDGRFRSEQQWPPADASMLTTALKPGAYTDDSMNNGDGSGAGKGIWTISQPLPYRAHFAGVPKIALDVEAPANANLVANVYDIGPDDKATLVSRGAYLLPGDGRIAFDLYGQDWILEPGHRIGVLVSSSNGEWWDHVPTGQEVTVKSGSIDLPFLTFKRTSDLEGEPTSRLAAVKARAFKIPASAPADGATTFALPPEQVERPKPATQAPSAPVVVPVAGGRPGEVVQASGVLSRRVVDRSRSSRTKRSTRIKLRARRLKGRRLLITGTAPKGMRLTIKVLRRGKVVAKRQVVARKGRIRLIVKLRRAGSHTVRATGRTGVETGSAAARRAAKVR